jgi:indole-3-glycerol phosphate synthase
MEKLLEKILGRKRGEVARSKTRLPAAVLESLLALAPPVRPFAARLQTGRGPHIIAEVKRASPTKGVLRPSDRPPRWDPEALVNAFVHGGAAAISVITDSHFFWGSADTLDLCRRATDLPAVRKDFVIDPYQVDESRWLGADAVMLVARAVDDLTLVECGRRARQLGMDVLVEIHDEDEIARALKVEGAVIGINHRDINSGHVDRHRAVHLAPKIPHGQLVVAESGLSGVHDLKVLMDVGIDCFLIGEALATSDDPTAALMALREAIT